MNKVLILIPSEKARGGITNFYQTLSTYFPPNIIFQYRGSRNFPYKKSFLREYFRIINDIIKFIVLLLKKNITLVQTTTSLNPKAVKRDGVFLILAKIFNKKTIVFFRGWDLDYANSLKDNKIFKSAYFKSDAFIVLTNKAGETLREWGYKKRIYHETTVVDDNLVKTVNENTLLEKYKDINGKYKILFLARIEKRKGIYELVQTLELLNKKFDNIQLTIAGDGREEKNLRKFIQKQNIHNIIFKGFVENESKINVFLENHIYVFPSYTEGMPTSVLEAMAFGLPIITTAVGGLVDFFLNETNGFMSEVPPQPNKMAEDIIKLLKNKNLMKSISLNNYRYAQKKFLASKVVKNNEKIFYEIINS